MSYTAPLSTPGTCTPSLSLTQSSSPTSHTLLSELQPCADLRRPPSGALAEPPSLTGHEPKQLAEHRDLAEHEDLRVKPLFFHRPSIASTYDSAESIVTPPLDSDLDDEQIRVLPASPLYLQEREANAERSQVYHSEPENLMSSSSQDPIRTGRPVALFSSKNRLNQETIPIEKTFP